MIEIKGSRSLLNNNSKYNFKNNFKRSDQRKKNTSSPISPTLKKKTTIYNKKTPLPSGGVGVGFQLRVIISMLLISTERPVAGLSTETRKVAVPLRSRLSAFTIAV